MGKRPTGRSLATSWGDRRQDDETDRTHRSTHRRIDGLEIPAELLLGSVGALLAVGTDQGWRVTPPADLHITKVVVACNVVPAVNLQIDVLVNGGSIFNTDGLPQIKAGENSGESSNVKIDKIRAGEWPILEIKSIGFGAGTPLLTVSIQGYEVPA